MFARFSFSILFSVFCLVYGLSGFLILFLYLYFFLLYTRCRSPLFLPGYLLSLSPCLSFFSLSLSIYLASSLSNLLFLFLSSLILPIYQFIHILFFVSPILLSVSVSPFRFVSFLLSLPVSLSPSFTRYTLPPSRNKKY